MDKRMASCIKSLEVFKTQLEDYARQDAMSRIEDRGGCLFSDYIYAGIDYTFPIIQAIETAENVSKIINFLSKSDMQETEKKEDR